MLKLLQKSNTSTENGELINDQQKSFINEEETSINFLDPYILWDMDPVAFFPVN